MPPRAELPVPYEEEEDGEEACAHRFSRSSNGKFGENLLTVIVPNVIA